MENAPRKKVIDILLVEDSESDRMLAMETLRGFRLANSVHCVADGEAAMEFLRRQGKYRDAPRPDLVLLDLNLPRMDGREVLGEIKGDPGLRLIPVVVLTTSRADEDVLAAYGLHANAYIAKPLDFGRFARVASMLENFWFEVVTLPPAAVAGDAVVRVNPATDTKLEPRSGADPAKPCRVLVVEDSPTDRLLLADALESAKPTKFMVSEVERMSQAESRLRLEGFDVVVADLGLPDCSGIETVRRLRRVAGRTPLIILTGLEDDETGLDILREGASDYLVKGQLGGRALARAIRYAMDRANFEEQLRHAQRMESLGVLAGGVAHDFNNLLTIIQGHAQMQRDMRLTEQALRASASEIVAAAERAAGLTRQLLTFSRRQRLNPEDLELNQVLGDFVKMLRRLIGPAIRVELRLTEEALPLYADRGMLEQVIMNLAINARDAMPAGGRLSLHTGRVVVNEEEIVGGGMVLAAGDYAELVVSDTGTGIAAEVLPHLFEPFFTTKEVGRGTGLGLATVFGIVQQHQGGITVASERGRGSSFRVRLPLTVRQGPAAEEPAKVAPKVEASVILLVDDEDMVRDLAEQVLRMDGHEVHAARGGPEALALWPQIEDRVCLLVTDLMMPDGISGRDLAERLTVRKPSLGVIYMSGYSSASISRDMCLTEGLNFVAKPFRIEQLQDAVRRALSASSAGG